ncbi:hypothetical protein [Bosea massiliensis]|uniref:Uncharacterized protein n=1 Tax=Bosea massiliensis TaxID=151419 RepID=A0ABW0PAE0_9HYPH
MNFAQLSEEERAELRKQILTHAHALEHASFDKGIPRIRGETAVKKAITTAALVYSGYLPQHWDAAVNQPDAAIQNVAEEVRKDADARRGEDEEFMDRMDSSLKNALP